MRAMWIVFWCLLAAFLLGIIWVGGWYFGVALAMKLGISLLLVGLGGLTVMFVHLQRTSRASKIERGLVDQGAKQPVQASALIQDGQHNTDGVHETCSGSLPRALEQRVVDVLDMPDMLLHRKGLESLGACGLSELVPEFGIVMHFPDLYAQVMGIAWGEE